MEGVIFSFIRDLPFFLTLRAAAAHEGPKPLPPQLDVMPGCVPTPLLERVKHVDSLGTFRYVQDAMLKSRVKSNLAHSGPDSWHRLPIQKPPPLLNLPEMEPRQAAGKLEGDVEMHAELSIRRLRAEDLPRPVICQRTSEGDARSRR